VHRGTEMLALNPHGTELVLRAPLIGALLPSD
jgi:hypothetical protein